MLSNPTELKSFESLPAELFVEIAKHLDKPDRKVFLNVNKIFNTIMHQYFFDNLHANLGFFTPDMQEQINILSKDIEVYRRSQTASFFNWRRGDRSQYLGCVMLVLAILYASDVYEPLLNLNTRITSTDPHVMSVTSFIPLVLAIHLIWMVPTTLFCAWLAFYLLHGSVSVNRVLNAMLAANPLDDQAFDDLKKLSDKHKYFLESINEVELRTKRVTFPQLMITLKGIIENSQKALDELIEYRNERLFGTIINEVDLKKAANDDSKRNVLKNLFTMWKNKQEETFIKDRTHRKRIIEFKI